VRLAIAQHAPLAAIRATPAPDAFALSEGLADQDQARAEWEATIHGLTLK
jgi:hypothetical protein